MFSRFDAVASRFAPSGERVQHPLWGTSNERAYGRVSQMPAPLPPLQEKAQVNHSFTKAFAPPRANTGFII